VPSTSRSAFKPHPDQEQSLAQWLRLAVFLILAIPLVQPLAAASAAGPASSSGGSSSSSAAGPSATSDSEPGDPASSTADPALASMEPPGGVDETLLLEVVVNGRPIGSVGEFVLRHGTLYVRPQEWQDLGFRAPKAGAGRGSLVALNDLPGIAWKIDVQKQQLLVTAIDAALTPAMVQPMQVDE
jgi:outer membrane usher protein FimD/PapC